MTSSPLPNPPIPLPFYEDLHQNLITQYSLLTSLPDQSSPLITKCLTSTYGTLFQTIADVLNSISDEDPLFLVCQSISSLNSDLSHSTFRSSSPSLLDSHPSDSPIIPSTRDVSDCFQCRVCDQLVPLSLFNSHTSSCGKLLSSSEKVKLDSELIRRLVLNLQTAKLNCQWPGEGPEIIQTILPTLHITVLLNQIASIGTGHPDDLTELQEITARFAEICSLPSFSVGPSIFKEAEPLISTKKQSLLIFIDAVKDTVDETPAVQETTIADFVFIKKFSSGGYAHVYLAEKKRSGDLYAIKAISLLLIQQKNCLEDVITEKNILVTQFSPEYIVQLCLFPFLTLSLRNSGCQ
jgi:serine/threonine protein kinase